MPIKLMVLALALMLGRASTASAESSVVMKTPHFIIEGDVGSKGLVERLASVAEYKRHYVQYLMDYRDESLIRVYVASTDEEMARLTGSTVWSRKWVAGVASTGRNEMVLSARGDGFFYATDTFVHELAHITLDKATGGRPTPLWFQEGVAMLVASEETGERLKSMFSAAATDSLFSLSDLTETFPQDPPAVHLAYAQSLLFVRFVLRQNQGPGLGSLLSTLRTGMSFDLAIESLYHESVESLHTRFLRSFHPIDAWLIFLTSGAVLWILVTGLFFYVYLKKRHQMELKRQAMPDDLPEPELDPAAAPSIEQKDEEIYEN